MGILSFRRAISPAVSLRLVLIAAAAAVIMVTAAAGQPRLQYVVFASGIGQGSNSGYAFAGTVGQPLVAPGFGFWSGPAATVVSAEEDETGVIPDRFFLHQNYPNPFNPSTTIQYDVAARTHVRIEVFDLVGRRVSILADRVHQPGVYRIEFEASRLASGLYVCLVEMGGDRFVRSMVLLK